MSLRSVSSRIWKSASPRAAWRLLKQFVQRADFFVLHCHLFSQRLQVRARRSTGLPPEIGEVGRDLPLQEFELLANRLHAGMIGANSARVNCSSNFTLKAKSWNETKLAALCGLVEIGFRKIGDFAACPNRRLAAGTGSDSPFSSSTIASCFPCFTAASMPSILRCV